MYVRYNIDVDVAILGYSFWSLVSSASLSRYLCLLLTFVCLFVVVVVVVDVCVC